MRTSIHQRALLEEASRVEGTTVTDFVLRHATRAAEDVLADRRFFAISDERWDDFMSALDAPPRDIPELRELLETPSVLDEV